MLTNCGSADNAERIADALLGQRLAAAVQIIGPVSSRYRWRGEVQSAQEWMLMIKTGDSRCEAVTDVIKKLHDYELPGVLTLNVDGGDAGYLHWLLAQSTPGAS